MGRMDTASRDPLDWLIAVCVNLPIPAIMIWKRSTGELSSSTAIRSGLIALAISNVVAVLAVRTKRKRRGDATSPTFALGAAGLAVIAGTIMAIGIVSVPTHNQYVDLAFSNIPLNQIHPERKALIVELIRRKAANSREYRSITSLAKPLSPALYSAESFANPDVIAKTIRQLKALADADFAYYAKQQEADKEFREKMSSVDPNYLKAIDAIDTDDIAERATVQLEEQWFSSTASLYKYAGAHHEEIEFREGVLKFLTKGVQSEFNHDLENCKTLHTQLQNRVRGSLSDKEKERAHIVMPTNLQTQLQ